MTSSPILLDLAGSTFSCELIVMDEVLGCTGHAQPLAQAFRPGLQGRVEGKLRPDCIWSRRLAPRCGQLLCLDGAGAAPWLAAPWLAAPWTTEPRGLCRGCSSSSSQARPGRGAGARVRAGGVALRKAAGFWAAAGAAVGRLVQQGHGAGWVPQAADGLQHPQHG